MHAGLAALSASPTFLKTAANLKKYFKCKQRIIFLQTFCFYGSRNIK